MNVIDAFIAIARKEVGYTETGVNLTKYNDWADAVSIWFTKVHGLAWCATFVAWCINELSTNYLFTLDDVCVDSKCCWSDHWMANFKQEARWFSEPFIGDLAFRNGHVGIVSSVLPSGAFKVIEGNVDNSVKEKLYFRKDWLGFGRPNWDDFWEADYEKKEITSAKEFVINQGIYIGREDGEMHWEDNLTRQEMAIALYRFWRKFIK